MAMANFTAQRTIHEDQSCKISVMNANRTTGSEPAGILAFFATLPRAHRRAKFTMPRHERRSGTDTFSMSNLFPLTFFR